MVRHLEMKPSRIGQQFLLEAWPADGTFRYSISVTSISTLLPKHDSQRQRIV